MRVICKRSDGNEGIPEGFWMELSLREAKQVAKMLCGYGTTEGGKTLGAAIRELIVATFRDARPMPSVIETKGGETDGIRATEADVEICQRLRRDGEADGKARGSAVS